MFSVYLGTFAFGALLICVSMFFGGADKDFDKDLDLEADLDGEVDLDGDVDVDGEVDIDLDGDVEVDVDVDGDAEVEGFDKDASGIGDFIWLPIFSMRFWTFGTASFGFTGTALTLGGLNWFATLALALLFGAAMGTGAAYFFKMLKKDSVSGSTSTRSYVGEEATVVLPVEPGGRGKIVLHTAGGDVEMVAVTKDGSPIARGSRVLIAGFKDGIADVSDLESPRKDKIAQRNAKSAQKA